MYLHKDDTHCVWLNIPGCLPDDDFPEYVGPLDACEMFIAESTDDDTSPYRYELAEFDPAQFLADDVTIELNPSREWWVASALINNHFRRVMFDTKPDPVDAARQLIARELAGR